MFKNEKSIFGSTKKCYSKLMSEDVATFTLFTWINISE